VSRGMNFAAIRSRKPRFNYVRRSGPKPAFIVERRRAPHAKTPFSRSNIDKSKGFPTQTRFAGQKGPLVGLVVGSEGREQRFAVLRP